MTDPRLLLLTRRRLLACGLGGALGAAFAGARPAWAGEPSAQACILVWLDGGPSQLETFDPKPGTLTGGETRAISTAIKGLRFAEHFPGLAERAGRLAVVRSLSSREGDHQRARYLVQTGYSPSTTIRHPTWGSVLSAERAGRADVPAFVSLGADPIGPGYRGAEHGAYEALARGALDPLAGLEGTRRGDRRALLAALEAPFARAVGIDPQARIKAFKRAGALIDGPLRDALRAPKGEGRRYGQGPVGESLLRARRLIEAGVGCVEVRVGGWDDHQDIFSGLPPRARALDQALSALLDDLRERGRLDRTLVLCMGEFGRTPDVNARGGRDHYPAAFSALLAGGGIRGGAVVGATSPDGRAVAERPVAVKDLYATLARLAGIDPAARRYAGERPITVVDGGKPIPELFPA